MSTEIINPRVLMVVFDRQDDNWIIKIPHAYGKGDHFTALISEKLSLQFQPQELVNYDNEHKTGIVCYPLTQVELPAPATDGEG